MTGWPRPRRVAGPGGPADAAVAIAAGLVAVVAGWIWATGELAGWSGTGRWPRVGVAGLADVARHLPHDLADPGRAWPAAAAAHHPAAALFYGWGAVVLAAVLGAGFAARRLARGRPAGEGARWARTADLRPVLVGRPGRPGRLVVGRAGPARPWHRSGLVATEARHSLLVVGPTQSGKTSGLAIPALLEWRGPVVATSVKDDLAGRTRAWRSTLGPCALFDPTQGSGLGPLSRWSPLSGCRSWTAAQRMAGWLVESTPGRRGMADAAFWYSTAAKPHVKGSTRRALGSPRHVATCLR